MNVVGERVEPWSLSPVEVWSATRVEPKFIGEMLKNS